MHLLPSCILHPFKSRIGYKKTPESWGLNKRVPLLEANYRILHMNQAYTGHHHRISAALEYRNYVPYLYMQAERFICINVDILVIPTD